MEFVVHPAATGPAESENPPPGLLNEEENPEGQSACVGGRIGRWLAGRAGDGAMETQGDTSFRAPMTLHRPRTTQ
jgi:hypothetical protein